MAIRRPIRRLNTVSSPVVDTTPVTDISFPSELLNVGGVIGDLAKACVENAKSPQPELALGASIAAVGVLAGHRYKHRSGLRTNVYAIGIVDSGGGKDYARGIIKRAFTAAGLASYLGGGELASGSGLMTSLERHPCRFFVIDEFGKFVKSVTGPRVGTHREAIWTKLTELYTSADGVMLGAEYSDQKLKPRVDIHQPCCSVWGVTTPVPMWEALNTGYLSDGSMARFLIFGTNQNYPDRQKRVTSGPIPENVIEGLKAVAAGFDAKPDDLPLLPNVEPDPYVVPADADADERLDQITDEQTRWLRSNEGTSSTAIIARYEENVTKVALIRAISDNPSNPKISLENVQWADKLVIHCIDTLLMEANQNVSDNQAGANHQLMEKVIRNAGSDGISQSDLTNKVSRKIPSRKERIDILNDLIEGMKVHRTDVPGAGRTGTMYYWLQ